jgi:hypothetical protein
VSFLITTRRGGRCRRERSQSGVLSLAVVAAVLILTLVAADALAEPLTFGNVLAVQPSPDDVTTSITTDLFATPEAILTNGTHVSFFIDVAGALGDGSSDTLRLSYVQAGRPLAVQEYAIPVFGTVAPPFTLVTGLDFPILYHAVPFTLTVDLLRSNPDFVVPSGPLAGRRMDSHAYTFSVVQPVPEPASLLLIGTGLLGAAGARRWRRRRS